MSSYKVTCNTPQGIEFRDILGYVAWANIVDHDIPRLRPQLHTTHAPSGAVVWLHLHDGPRLTADGVDVLIDAARRAQRTVRGLP